MRYIQYFIRTLFLVLALCIIPSQMSYSQQIEIPRITTMPDFPQPYDMRHWKLVARGYDSLVFNQNLQGQYQPFVFFREQSVNYPGFPSFGLHTAVGTNAPMSGEAINVIPAVVGATLVGIDKSQQFGHNWASMLREYFNNRPQENIYLNHPSTDSGNDWWYETMPNIFFMQLKDLYPEIDVFDEQLPVMANQWEQAVRSMGASDTPWSIPYMNYRAWNMSQMQPLDEGVKQPEAAGALAWILYNAYQVTGNTQYRKAAEWSMEFLEQWQQNPSYELQLPYGIYTAARMNAEIGTQYNVEKMVNWAFSRGHLRGWGAIQGNWGGYDVHGLIGEANDNGNDYAFMMNGFQQAAALVPMLRYDYRFAKAIAKWVLNMANASRLFYPAYLPADMQDNASWAQTYDPNSFIAYEALREVKNGKRPYMTGDAMEGGWAQTNLMLYGSSHVGYLAAIVDTTNVEGILKLDLLKTDFYRQEAFPTWLYYNPFNETHPVDLYLDNGTFKVYDVIGKQIIHENQNGKVTIQLPAGGVIMAVVVPQSEPISVDGRKTLAGNVVIDFNNGQPPGPLPPRIKALAAQDTLLVAGGVTGIFCTATDPQQSELTYQWFLPETDFTGEDHIQFQELQQLGTYTIACKVSNSLGLSDSTSVTVRIVEKIPYDPVIHSITANPRKLRPFEQSVISCFAEDFYDEPLNFQWDAEEGFITGENAEVVFTSPARTGNFYIRCTVRNADGLWTSDSIQVMVREYPQQGEGNRVAWYPLRGDVNDYSGNNLNATAGGGLSYTYDMVGLNNNAAAFNGQTAYVLLPASDKFDFTEQMAVTAFLMMNTATPHEQHPVSHGSWEHRYKISISGERIRFTLNTSDGIKDLDSETIILPGKWYHLAVVYTGEDMEIWVDGHLDAFTAHSGSIRISPVQPVLGQNIPGNNLYNFHGALSMVHFFDYALSPLEIQDNLSLNTLPLAHDYSGDLLIYPNPVVLSSLNIKTSGNYNGSLIWQILDVRGQIIQSGYTTLSPEGDVRIILPSGITSGIYIVRITNGKDMKTARFAVLR